MRYYRVVLDAGAYQINFDMHLSKEHKWADVRILAYDIRAAEYPELEIVSIKEVVSES